MRLTNYLKTLADAFRSKLGTTDTINAQDFPTKINEVYDAGKQAERDAFWDAYQNYGNTNGTNYRYAFVYDRFTNDTFNPIHPIICNNDSSAAQNMFYSSSLTSTKVPIYAKNSLPNTFQDASIETIVLLDVNSRTTFSNTFASCTLLKEIRMSGEIGNNIVFAACVSLSKDSIISIINTLSPTIQSKTLTLNEEAVQTAFGTTDLDSSTEWNTLKSSKSNWTITLA